MLLVCYQAVNCVCDLKTHVLGVLCVGVCDLKTYIFRARCVGVCDLKTHVFRVHCVGVCDPKTHVFRVRCVGVCDPKTHVLCVRCVGVCDLKTHVLLCWCMYSIVYLYRYRVFTSRYSSTMISACPSEIDECVAHLCDNNGTCVDAVNGYKCACAIGFTGRLCETGKTKI